MVVWFIVLALLGLGGIWHAPQILGALNPWRAVDFLVHAGWHVSFAMLGAAFLAVTGGEAMYADLGHFGADPSASPGSVSSCRPSSSIISARAGFCWWSPTRSRTRSTA